jgi:hypothetical protein
MGPARFVRFDAAEEVRHAAAFPMFEHSCLKDC